MRRMPGYLVGMHGMGWVLGMPGGVEPGRLVLLRRSPDVSDGRHT